MPEYSTLIGTQRPSTTVQAYKGVSSMSLIMHTFVIGVVVVVVGAAAVVVGDDVAGAATRDNCLCYERTIRSLLRNKASTLITRVLVA